MSYLRRLWSRFRSARGGRATTWARAGREGGRGSVWLGFPGPRSPPIGRLGNFSAWTWTTGGLGCPAAQPSRGRAAAQASCLGQKASPLQCEPPCTLAADAKPGPATGTGPGACGRGPAQPFPACPGGDLTMPLAQRGPLRPLKEHHSWGLGRRGASPPTPVA